MDNDFWLNLLGNVSLPSALCFYTLFEVNKNVKRLSDSIDRLSNEIERRLSTLEKEYLELRHIMDTRRGN